MCCLDRITELERLCAETSKVVDQSTQLRNDAELKPNAWVQNPDDMNAPQLADQIQQFHDNVKEALEEARRRQSALSAKDQAQQLIIEIHRTFKEVEQLQQKSPLTPMTLRKIGDKLDAVKPQLDSMRAVYADSEPQGQDVRGKPFCWEFYSF